MTAELPQYGSWLFLNLWCNPAAASEAHSDANEQTAAPALAHVPMIVSVVLYDWLLCFPSEVEFLSAGPKITVAKVVYTMCRYWPIITHPITLYLERLPGHSVYFCPSHSRIPLYLGVINLALAAGLMTIRLYAFTGCRRIVASGLILACVAVISYQLWAVSSVIAISGPMRCFLTDIRLASPKQAQFAKDLLGGYFVAPLSFDCLSLLIFVIHAFRTLDFSSSTLSPLHGLNSLTQTFLQQGFLYFFAISAINAINTALMHIAPFDPYFLNCAWISNFFTVLSLLLPNVLACRMVLELRSVALKPTWSDDSQFIESALIAKALPRLPSSDSVSTV
ncbi:hypothetical protein BKA62DRAFT_755816 [Auriculariales sp. MPI-PUGE-AT-0066]|nr:hypothetical protein BKA62DRAFT_755816 [Auriculariales sp. MPI-PUGE-AT-0066]